MKVQIIDDSLFLRKTIRRYLSDLDAQFTIIESSGGKEGIEHFDAERPDLVTLDLLMDDIHGTDVIKHIRGTKADCFIAIVSSDIQKTMQEKVYSLGADIFIGKPFTPESANRIIDTYKSKRLKQV